MYVVVVQKFTFAISSPDEFLSNNVPNSLICLSGYRVFRRDRGTHGGGVANYIKDTNIGLKPTTILMQEKRFLPIALLTFGTLCLQQSILVIMSLFLNAV